MTDINVVREILLGYRIMLEQGMILSDLQKSFYELMQKEHFNELVKADLNESVNVRSFVGAVE